jgi:hypothetical protein
MNENVLRHNVLIILLHFFILMTFNMDSSANNVLDIFTETKFKTTIILIPYLHV